MKVTAAMRKAVFEEVGRKGGHARRDALTPERRKEIARDAGKASGIARKRKAEAA